MSEGWQRDAAVLFVGSVSGILATTVTFAALLDPRSRASIAESTPASTAAPQTSAPQVLAGLQCQPMPCLSGSCRDHCKVTIRDLTVGIATEEQAKASLASLHKRKRHPVALLTGTGRSIGQLTYSQADFVHRTMDVWAMNQFFLHKYLVPSFYLLEVGRQRNTSSLDWWAANFDARKRLDYLETVFFTTAQHASVVRDMLRAHRPCPRHVMRYERWQVRDSCRKLKRLDFHPHLVTDFCASSLSRALHLIMRLGYTRVCFLGVDLTSPVHFYAGRGYESVQVPLYEHLVVESQRRDADTPKKGFKRHPTAQRGIVNFLKVFRKQTGIEFVNLSGESLLAHESFLTTKSLAELAEEWRKDPAAVHRIWRQPVVGADDDWNGTALGRQ